MNDASLIARRCPACKTEVPPAANFCPECAPQTTTFRVATVDRRADTPQQPAARIRQSDTLPDGERNTITAWFADIKGSMALLEDLG